MPPQSIFLTRIVPKPQLSAASSMKITPSGAPLKFRRSSASKVTSAAMPDINARTWRPLGLVFRMYTLKIDVQSGMV